MFDHYLSKIQHRPNKQQLGAIDPGPDASLFIVAGPGSGKTSLLVTRILKLIFVDGVDPRSILATTFTKKAAAELRSRILGRGYHMLENLQKDPQINSIEKDWLSNIDINQVITGTIDSICEQILRDYRQPGVLPPLLADEFICNTLMLREGLLNNNRFRNQALDDLLAGIQGTRWKLNVGSKTTFLTEIWNRRYNDQVNWPDFVLHGQQHVGRAITVIDEALTDYHAALINRDMVDFTLLEQAVLSKLEAGELEEFTDNIRLIMVDEYQDTNLMQESIYFELAKRCNGAITVVGDDDQSLYRFRGATIQLFSQYSDRYNNVFGRRPTLTFLSTNYRSTQTIVELSNQYAILDNDYQAARVSNKPALASDLKAEIGLPILGMFRDNLTTLTVDLAEFIYQVFRGNGLRLPQGETIVRNPDGGDLGDCALLCNSPLEVKNDGTLRLPNTLRNTLLMMDPPIYVFNPRGQDLAEINIIQIFGGLVLECLDESGVIQNSISGLSNDIARVLNSWRAIAIDFANKPSCPHGLIDYATGWIDRNPNKQGHTWPKNVPFLKLLYDLVHWFPELHDDPEGQLYLELFTRQVSSTETIGSFKGRIIYDPTNQTLTEKSIIEIYRNVIFPIASGAVKINEELVENFPRDRLNILSIHQAKGLEFPMVIVDIGSDFRSNHHAHAFKRFPRNGGKVHQLEDLMRPFSPLGVERRSQLDRAFDDLYRQYFVAFSRPQKILLIVGLNEARPGGAINNVATGNDRYASNCWPRVPYLEI